MKTFEIKTLLFVAAIACLPIACGTTSVTGPDATSLVGPATTVSAQRTIDPQPLPPMAPPADPQGQPGAITPATDDAPEVNVPNTDAHQGTHQPTTDPNHTDPGQTDPSQTDPSQGNPSQGDPNGIPGATPLPVDVPPQTRCLAASVEIVELYLFSAAPGLSLEARLLDDQQAAITDGSCDKLEWRLEATDGRTGGAIELATIIYGTDTRYVKVIGAAGAYKVGVTAPNGITSSRLIELN
jgi:hypothetical protein